MVKVLKKILGGYTFTYILINSSQLFSVLITVIY